MLARHQIVLSLFILVGSLHFSPAQAQLSYYPVFIDAARKAADQGRPDEAERLYRKALALSDSGDDPVAASNLGSILYDFAKYLHEIGKDKEAEVLVRRLSKVARPIQSQESVQFLLGATLFGQRRYKEAQQVLNSVVDKQTKNYSTVSEKTREIMLAICADALGQSDEKKVHTAKAIDLVKRASRSQKETKLDESSLQSLAAWLDARREEEDAAIVWQYVNQVNVKKHGVASSQTVASLCEEAKHLGQKYYYRQAYSVLDQGLSDKSMPKASRLDLLETKYDLLDREQQRGKKTIPAKLALLKELAALSEQVRGASNEKTNQWQYKLLDEFKATGSLAEGEKYMLDLIAAIQKSEGAESTNAADKMTTLSYWCYKDQPNKAIPVMDRAIKIFEKSEKPMPAFLVSGMLTSQAKNYRAVKKYDQSDLLYKRTIKIWDNMKFEQPLLTVLPEYSAMLKEAGKNTEAEAAEKRSVQIYNKYKDPCGYVGFGGGGQISKW